MMEVIVDTTTLHDHAAEMDSNAWTAVLAASKRGNISLSVPLVVLREAERQVRAATEDSLRSLSATAKKIRASTSRNSLEQFLSNFRAHADQDAADYLTRARNKIEENGGRILELPNVSHEEVFERAITFTQPFKRDGSGYRDSLIWLSVLDVVKNCPAGTEVLFVSGNTKDFASGDLLAPLLEAEVSEAAQGVKVRLVHKLQDLTPLLEQAKHAKSEDRGTSAPASQDIEQVEADAAVSRLSEVETAISDTIESLLWDEISTASEPGLPIEIDLPSAFQTPVLASVDPDFGTLSTQAYDVFEGDDRLIRAELTAEIEVHGVVDKYDVHALPDDVYVSNYDLNNHYSEVSTTKTVDLVFDVLQSDGGYVQNCDFIEGASV